MGTMNGLEVPRYGAYTRGSEDQTTVMSVDDEGMENFTFDQPGADNMMAITVTDSSTVTSGYMQGYYASITASGAYSTGNTQINGMAVDLFLAGTIACEVEGLYVYVSKSGEPTVTSANVNGINIYIDDLYAAPSTRSCIQLHIADGNVGSSQDGFIVMRIEGSSASVTNMFSKNGTAQNPTFFLYTNAVTEMVTAGDFITNASSAYGLACNINGTTRYIPLVSNT